MKRFKTLMAAIIIIASLVLIFLTFFAQGQTPESGQEATDEDYFSLPQALMLSIASFLVGSLVMFLYYQDDRNQLLQLIRQHDPHAHVIPMLKQDEKMVLLEVKAKGDLLQNALVEKTGLSKVKITRILTRLEKKGLIVRERYGLTNKLKIK